MARQIVIDYVPTPKQALFHSTDADEVLYGGAAGGGKSKACVMDALARCLRYPRSHAYIFRRTFRELEDTVIAEAKASYPQGLGRYVAGHHEYRLNNGSIIHFRHCASVEDMYTYAGAEIHFLYIDELTTFEREIFDFLKTRLRAKKTLGLVPVVRCTSNPGNIGHGWVKAYFVDAGPFMEKIRHEIVSSALGETKIVWTQYIPSLATENPHITKDYIFELEKKPDALRRALLMGEWDAFEGQVFLEWKDDPAHYRDRLWTHVVEPFAIPTHWPRYMSFDHGYSKPFSVGWWAVSPDNVAYRYKEWYGWNGTVNKGCEMSPAAIARGIVEREVDERANNIFVDRIADPAIFDRSRGDSVAQMMEPQGDHDGVFFRKGDNTRLAGKMQFHERLRFDENGRPKMQIFNTCRQFIRTIPSLPYDLHKVEDVDSDAEDHIYDETRYFLMARPVPVNDPHMPKRRVFDPLAD